MLSYGQVIKNQANIFVEKKYIRTFAANLWATGPLIN